MFRGFPSVPRGVSKGPCYDLCSGEFPVFQKKSYQCSGDSPLFKEKFQRVHVMICVLESFQCFIRKLISVPGIPQCSKRSFKGFMLWSVFWRVPSVSEESLLVFRGFPSVPREVSKGPCYDLWSGEFPVFQKKSYQCSGDSPVFQEKFLRVHVMICVLESFQCFRRKLISVPGIPQCSKGSF